MIKPLLHRLLGAVGLRMIREDHPAVRYVELVPDSAFDLLVAWIFPDLHGRSFLQIGANDGVSNDPLFRWIQRYGWRGTLVEPMPDFAGALRRLHANRTGIRIVEAAVTEAPAAGPLTLYRIDPELTGLPPWAQGLATLDPDRMRQAVRDLGATPGAFVRTSVEAVEMKRLLATLPDGPPEVVVIDSEGYDIRLARALLAAGARPAILHFEHACCSVDERFAFARELVEAGYEIATYGPDTTAFREIHRSTEPKLTDRGTVAAMNNVP